jgi:hypothetical protein
MSSAPRRCVGGLARTRADAASAGCIVYQIDMIEEREFLTPCYPNFNPYTRRRVGRLCPLVAPSATLQDKAHVEIVPGPFQVDRLALVGERGAAADHDRATYAREVRRQAFSDAVGEILLLGIAAGVGEG